MIFKKLNFLNVFIYFLIFLEFLLLLTSSVYSCRMYNSYFFTYDFKFSEYVEFTNTSNLKLYNEKEEIFLEIINVTTVEQNKYVFTISQKEKSKYLKPNSQYYFNLSVVDLAGNELDQTICFQTQSIVYTFQVIKPKYGGFRGNDLEIEINVSYPSSECRFSIKENKPYNEKILMNKMNDFQFKTTIKNPPDEETYYFECRDIHNTGFYQSAPYVFKRINESLNFTITLSPTKTSKMDQIFTISYISNLPIQCRYDFKDKSRFEEYNYVINSEFSRSTTSTLTIPVEYRKKGKFKIYAACVDEANELDKRSFEIEFLDKYIFQIAWPINNCEVIKNKASIRIYSTSLEAPCQMYLNDAFIYLDSKYFIKEDNYWNIMLFDAGLITDLGNYTFKIICSFDGENVERSVNFNVVSLTDPIKNIDISQPLCRGYINGTIKFNYDLSKIKYQVIFSKSSDINDFSSYINASDLTITNDTFFVFFNKTITDPVYLLINSSYSSCSEEYLFSPYSRLLDTAYFADCKDEFPPRFVITSSKNNLFPNIPIKYELFDKKDPFEKYEVVPFSEYKNYNVVYCFISDDSKGFKFNDNICSSSLKKGTIDLTKKQFTLNDFIQNNELSPIENSENYTLKIYFEYRDAQSNVNASYEIFTFNLSNYFKKDPSKECSLEKLENCPDSDGDEIPDLWEDEFCGGVDKCGKEGDLDNDGLTDYEEFIHGLDPNNPDTDGDGLTDYDEVKTYTTDPKKADTDDDGLSDGEEVKTYTTDPKKPDTDGDGLTDYDEVKTYATDPKKKDTDDDGLTDYDEVKTHSTDPKKADTDGDNFNDYDEVKCGSNPKDTKSTCESIKPKEEKKEEIKEEKNNSILWIILLAVIGVVILGGGGAIYYFVYKNSKNKKVINQGTTMPSLPAQQLPSLQTYDQSRQILYNIDKNALSNEEKELMKLFDKGLFGLEDDTDFSNFEDSELEELKRIVNSNKDERFKNIQHVDSIEQIASSEIKDIHKFINFISPEILNENLSKDEILNRLDFYERVGLISKEKKQEIVDYLKKIGKL
ncbi:MAG: hypothetical protein QXS41_01010 [Candidatus Woesearchaeota archaeon]